MLQVPADGAGHPLGKGHGGGPAQLVAELGGVDGVAPVVPRAVLDEADQGAPGLARGQQAPGPVQEVADGENDLQVRLLGVAADGVGLPEPALLEHRGERRAVVFHVQPVPDVLAVPVHRELAPLQGVVDDQGDELLGELEGAVVVGAVGDDDRQAVGVVVGPGQVVRGGLAGGVGGAGIVGGGLGEAPGLPQGAVHLVGADVQEAVTGGRRRVAGGRAPGVAGGLQQGEGPGDVGADELAGALDATVHVGLGGEVHHPVHGLLPKHPGHQVGVADVAPHEAVPGVVGEVGQVLGVARVGEAVEVDDPRPGPARQGEPHEVGADEAAAAGDEECVHGWVSLGRGEGRAATVYRKGRVAVKGFVAGSPGPCASPGRGSAARAPRPSA